MIVLYCSLDYSFSTGHGPNFKPWTLSSIVYNELTDSFVRVSQRLSSDFVQDLRANSKIDIPKSPLLDIINLDFIEYVFKEEELEDIFKMVDESNLPDNEMFTEALNFITSYRRNSKIKSIIEGNNI